VLPHLNAVEELTCGYQLEEYIRRERESTGLLPNLKIVNGIDASITAMDERNKMHDACTLLEKLPLIANSYVLG